MAYSNYGGALANSNSTNDHSACFPQTAVDLVAATANLPAVLTGFIDPFGASKVHINIYAAAPATGSFGVYTWDEASGKCILFAAQNFNTAANAVYVLDINGRPFFVKHLSGGAVNYSYTLIKG